jgi:hypothetical protein
VTINLMGRRRKKTVTQPEQEQGPKPLRKGPWVEDILLGPRLSFSNLQLTGIDTIFYGYLRKDEIMDFDQTKKDEEINGTGIIGNVVSRYRDSADFGQTIYKQISDPRPIENYYDMSDLLTSPHKEILEIEGKVFTLKAVAKYTYDKGDKYLDDLQFYMTGTDNIERTVSPLPEDIAGLQLFIKDILRK